MKKIELTHGKFAIVDDEDYEELNKYKWNYKDNGYAVRSKQINGVRLPNIFMHRVIMNTPLDKECDHINGDRLDNRKENLRVCTHAQNCYNKVKKPNTTSKYRGVYFESQTKKWCARAQKNKKQHYLGLFITEEEAALAYNQKARELFGEFARLNVVYREVI